MFSSFREAEQYFNEQEINTIIALLPVSVFSQGTIFCPKLERSVGSE